MDPRWSAEVGAGWRWRLRDGGEASPYGMIGYGTTDTAATPPFSVLRPRRPGLEAPRTCQEGAKRSGPTLTCSSFTESGENRQLLPAERTRRLLTPRALSSNEDGLEGLVQGNWIPQSIMIHAMALISGDFGPMASQVVDRHCVALLPVVRQCLGLPALRSGPIDLVRGHVHTPPIGIIGPRRRATSVLFHRSFASTSVLQPSQAGLAQFPTSHQHTVSVSCEEAFLFWATCSRTFNPPGAFWAADSVTFNRSG